MARYLCLFTVLLLSPYVFCEECVTYDFENDFENLFSNEFGLCGQLQLPSWVLGNYSSVAIENLNANTISFISPSSDLSCVSSFAFPIETSGVVEVNVYMDAMSPSDIVSVIVNKVSTVNEGIAVSTVSLSAADPSFVGGWRVLKIDLAVSETFDGYITILGLASAGSTVLVDSFRYIPRSVDEESCVIYENDNTETTTEQATTNIEDNDSENDFSETTTEQTITDIDDNENDITETSTEQTITDNDSENEISETTTEQAITDIDDDDNDNDDDDNDNDDDDNDNDNDDDDNDNDDDDDIDTTTAEPVINNEDCVTYDFELDYNNLFNDETDLCEEYMSWSQANYTSLSIDSPCINSELFISPNVLPSCISSFVFTMTPKGVVEANVYMDPKSELDYIIVLAKKVVPNGVDTVAGFLLYYPSNEKFVTGWNTLRFSVDDFTPFEGYLTFIGAAAEDSIILIDSFRYISPTAVNNEESCTIYRDPNNQAY